MGAITITAWVALAVWIGASGTAAFKTYKIPSGAMVPTLLIGDHLIAERLRDTALLRHGDVIVFTYPKDPEKDFIKRLVGLAGDIVEVKAKRLYLNGAPAADPHAYFVEELSRSSAPRDDFGPFTVPPGTVFVMGDNRDRSYDSRFWGPVTLDAIKSRATMIYWSWDGEHARVRWERIGRRIR